MSARVRPHDQPTSAPGALLQGRGLVQPDHPGPQQVAAPVESDGRIGIGRIDPLASGGIDRNPIGPDDRFRDASAIMVDPGSLAPALLTMVARRTELQVARLAARDAQARLGLDQCLEKGRYGTIMVAVGDAQKIRNLEPRCVGHDVATYLLRTAAAPRLSPAPPVLETTPTPFGVGTCRSPARPSS